MNKETSPDLTAGIKKDLKLAKEAIAAKREEDLAAEFEQWRERNTLEYVDRLLQIIKQTDPLDIFDLIESSPDIQSITDFEQVPESEQSIEFGIFLKDLLTDALESYKKRIENKFKEVLDDIWVAEKEMRAKLSLTREEIANKGYIN
jgi:hypothetical protein